MNSGLNPNPYYYDDAGGIRHSGDNDTFAQFGARNRLPCGGFWIIGKDFAFCLNFAADNYRSPFSLVREFGPKTTRLWPELRQHLCDVERNWHTLKSRDTVAAELGISHGLN